MFAPAAGWGAFGGARLPISCATLAARHGPNDYRANGPLANMPEFHAAFGVQPGDAMYVPPEERVDIW